jgi:antitoxin HicB
VIAMLAYPVILEPDDNGTVLVTFPDVPEAVTFGEDESDAFKRAVDALETMLAARIADREEVPLPSAAMGRPCAVLPALATAKVLLYRAMRELDVSKAELARRLGWHDHQVDRLLDLSHPSRLDQIETALAALGKRLDIRMSDAA